MTQGYPAAFHLPEHDFRLYPVRQLEAGFDRHIRTQPRVLGEADRERIRRLAGEVPSLWRASSTTPADRRQVVRLLVERVVLTVDPDDDRVAVRVEWAGGVVRERVIHRAVRGYKDRQLWACLSERLAAMHGRGETPEAIAAALDREGFRPPKRASAVHGRDGAAVAARTGIAAARAALAAAGRGPVTGRAMVTRPGAGPGAVTAHAARVAEEGLASRPPGRRPWRPVGGVGGRVRTGPPAGVEGVPAHVDPSRAVGRITDTGATTRMITSVPSWHSRGGTDFSHNLFLGGYCARLIENSLHWQLDMSFREDRSRVRKDHAGANMAALRRLVLGLLKNEASKKVGIKNKRLVAAWNIDYLRQVLFGE